MVAYFYRYGCKFQRDGLFHALHTCRCLGEWPQCSPSKKTPEKLILPVFCQRADAKFDTILFSVDSGWCIGRVYFLSSAGQSS